MSTETTASVSTHILDTSTGRPARGVTVTLAVRAAGGAPWTALGGSVTDGDGRCTDLPALPEGTTRVRLGFDTEAYFASQDSSLRDGSSQDSSSRDGTHQSSTHQSSTTRQAEAQQDAPRVRDSGPFFPEVAVTFAVVPGEHFHVPLLLNPFGYSVYRGS